MGFTLNRGDFMPIRYTNKSMERVYKPRIVQGIGNIGVRKIRKEINRVTDTKKP